MVRVTTINLNDKSYPTSGPLDLIFCRNVLIYFDHAKKLEILTRIMEYLPPGGLLCLGHADSIAGMRLPLQPLLPSIYQRM
jgi:chemotaxis protein methyltransferase CheR